ncbi:MAG: hypothetical protein JOZ55_11540 [Alphaproteobacteria bacterium]|nr:hypothetical protein [Alphaproteobacteria bacterium]
MAKFAPGTWAVIGAGLLAACGPSGSAQKGEGGIPLGIPQAAADASITAKQWHSDARLVIVDVDRNGAGGQIETRFSFLSPSTGEGAWINSGQLTSAGQASWPKRPIPAKFIDLSEAVAKAHAQGMQGPIDRAELMWSDGELSWNVVPQNDTSMDSNYIIKAGGADTSGGFFGTATH